VRAEFFPQRCLREIRLGIHETCGRSSAFRRHTYHRRGILARASAMSAVTLIEQTRISAVSIVSSPTISDVKRHFPISAPAISIATLRSQPNDRQATQGSGSRRKVWFVAVKIVEQFHQRVVTTSPNCRPRVLDYARLPFRKRFLTA
jgi:hypothetical protein